MVQLEVRGPQLQKKETGATLTKNRELLQLTVVGSHGLLALKNHSSLSRESSLGRREARISGRASRARLGSPAGGGGEVASPGCLPLTREVLISWGSTARRGVVRLLLCR